MIIHKLIEIGVDIESPIAFFNDTNNNLLTYLKDNYEHKCFRSCFITKIERIIKYSEPIIDQEQDNCFAKLNVQFEVKAVSYTPGDIITGCRVVNKDRTGSLLCYSKFAFIGLKGHKYLQSIKPDQLISIVVGDASYHPGSEKISVKGLPLLFKQHSNLYRIDTSKLSLDQKDIINNMLNQIKEEEIKCDDLKKINIRGWEFFDNLLYAYKKEQPLPNDAVEISIFIDSINDKELIGWISRDHKIRLSKPVMYFYKRPPDTIYNIPDSDNMESYLSILNNYYNFIKTIRKMTKLYNTEEMLSSHENLWKIFKKSKLE